MTTSRVTGIHRHSRLVAAARMPLAAAWIGMRFLLVPLLRLCYRPGRRMSWAFWTDAFMKRALYPLTEAPDDALRNDVDAPMAQPDRAGVAAGARQGGAATAARGASGWARLAGQPVDLERFAQGRPLLLILFRGSWCPYSRLHLADLSTITGPLEALGVAILAVSARNHDRWWQSRGVDLNFATDPDGALFDVMGVRVEPPLSHRVWGMLLPHESVFLFDRDGRLVEADVRRLNGIKAGQTFLAASRWLALARELVQPAAAARPTGTPLAGP